MYNFLDPKLLPKVSPVPGSLEGYEPSNLISENPLIKSRGFLTYSCIKPPVDIDFELICPVSISYVSITCKIGTQQITAIELQAKTDAKSSTFTTIGKAFIDEEKVLFCNSRYYTKEQALKINQNACVAFLKGNLFRLFVNAKFVRVKILRTERSTPGLGPVEIWGRVSKQCQRVTVETIEKLMLKDERQGNVDSRSANTFYASDVEQVECGFEIDEDFKDALTFEVMALPMTLPSGHTVDQSTLEKCAQNDARYGRAFSDPFTGMPFTDGRKPKLNAALKNRIDMFLLTNAHRKETYGISRTVGSNINNKNVTNKRIRNTTDENASKPSTSSYGNKKPRTARDTKPTGGEQNNHSRKTCYNPHNVLSKVVTTNFACKKRTDCDKSDDLDDAIAKVMSSANFVSFTKDQPVVEDNLNTKTCSLCEAGSIMYSLPCKHIYCKDCLLNVCKELTCGKCARPFSKNEVVRVHV